jgi:pyridoxal phosphate enzyme (YggS family)
MESKSPIPREAIQRNLACVRDSIAKAAQKSGRDPNAIKLIAVTKYVGLPEIEALYAMGVRDFGESRIQDAEKKARALHLEGIRWHLIGHLQTNKADKAVEIFSTIHSIDSARVAQALEKESGKSKAATTPLPCLIEVNVAGEANKYGLKPDLSEIEAALRVCAGLKHLSVRGLMCMAPYADNPEPTSRPVFRRLRELMGEINSKQIYPQPLTELSMGMTQDYTIAIEEGATMVRIGSALFENPA